PPPRATGSGMISAMACHVACRSLLYLNRGARERRQALS
ncbi:hypothetical protein DIZ40_17120, partial [Legionella pneumophila]